MAVATMPQMLAQMSWWAYLVAVRCTYERCTSKMRDTMHFWKDHCGWIHSPLLSPNSVPSPSHHQAF